MDLEIKTSCAFFNIVSLYDRMCSFVDKFIRAESEWECWLFFWVGILHNNLQQKSIALSFVLHLRGSMKKYNPPKV